MITQIIQNYQTTKKYKPGDILTLISIATFNSHGPVYAPMYLQSLSVYK